MLLEGLLRGGVEDVAAAKEFYGRVFELPVHWEDENSVVFVFGPTMINLLQVGEAADLVGLLDAAC